MRRGISQQHGEESISKACVHAIAGSAGMLVEKADHDDGVDGTFGTVKRYRNKIKADGYKLDFQLKGSMNIRHLQSGAISYDIEVDAYMWRREIIITRAQHHRSDFRTHTNCHHKWSRIQFN